MRDLTPITGLTADDIVPSTVLARLREQGLDPIAPTPGGETADEAAARTRMAEEMRHRRWDRLVPSRFAEADLGDLTMAQDPDGRIRGWWASTAETLIIRGNPGLGKSHAAYAIGHQAAQERKWVTAWTAIGLNDALRPGGDETAYDVACGADLLLLLDLGAEKITDWTVERLLGIFDTRWAERRRTVIETNLAGPDLQARYGDRFVDRLVDGAVIAHMPGDSRRKPAPW